MPEYPVSAQEGRSFCGGLTNNYLSGKVALITGGSSGFGRAIALAYAESGAYIVSADLSPFPPGTNRVETTEKTTASSNDDERTTPTDELINRIFPATSGFEASLKEDGGKGISANDSLSPKKPVRCHYVPCDVTSAESVELAVAKTVRRFGRLDIMVNNAGVAAEAGAFSARPSHEQQSASKNRPSLRVHEAPVSNWDTTMTVNGKGVWLGCKFAIAQMLKQEPLTKMNTTISPSSSSAIPPRGWVINMSSIAGLVGLPGSSVYCASKGAVLQMTKAIALEYAQDGIYVNCINPGFAQTNLLQGVLNNAEIGADEMQRKLEGSIPLGRLGTAEDVARVAVFLVQDSWITGHALVVDGGYITQ